MNDWDVKRKKRLAFLGQKDIHTQTDDFIHLNSDEYCSSCNKPFSISQNNQNNYIGLACGHSFCINCLQRLLSAQIKIQTNLELHCPICSHPLNDPEIDKINPEYTKIMTKRFASQFGQTVLCPKCKSDFILEPGSVAQITVDLKGEKIRPAALECLRQYRVSCPICQTNFCANCNSIPFHDGFTCDEQKLLDDDIVCRFCQEYPAVGCRDLDACHRVCWRQECRECLPQSCMHVCDCGHACCGLKNEQNHFGCALCSQKVAYCVICHDSCTTSPSVLMKCGHPIHKSCLQMYYNGLDLKGRLHIPRCNFDFTCQCVPYHECVKDVAQKWIDLNMKIEELIAMRMKIEDTENEPDHVKNENDPDYFNQPLKYARDFFVFYLCDKCHEPYYAGHKDCGNDDQNSHNGPHECMRCNRQLLNVICPKHGQNGMIFKCMFCCSPSIWLCYNNTTYFCDPCHRRAGSVENGPFPQCDGHCKFAPHVPNGQRTITAYCVLCEQEKENALLNKK